MNENRNKVRKYVTEINLNNNDGSNYDLIETLRSKFELDITYNPPAHRGCEQKGEMTIKVYQLV